MRGVTTGPLLVYGPRSTAYDFGPNHPLTPRRFGPGIDLLRTIGAVPGLAPEPADEAELLEIHARRYVAAVRRDARGGGIRGRRLAPGDGGNSARRRRARLPSGRRPSPRDAGAGFRV